MLRGPRARDSHRLLQVKEVTLIFKHLDLKLKRKSGLQLAGREHRFSCVRRTFDMAKLIAHEEAKRLEFLHSIFKLNLYIGI